MQTPSLRGRIVLAGVLAGSLVLLGVDVFVWLSLRDRLMDNLAGVLESRAQLVVEIGPGLSPVELDERLTELGVPAVVHPPGGPGLPAEPVAPRVRNLPPADPLGPISSSIERDVHLPDGTRVTVLASRAGVDATLRQVLILEVIASVAAITLLVALLHHISRRAVGPVDQIVRTARRIADGRTGERLRPDRPETELGRMATAFDEMLDALEDAVDEARDAEARMRIFLAQAAHQLRTPVAALRSCVDALLRIDDVQERDRLLDHLAKESARVSRLVRSLLRLAELDEADVGLSTPERLDLDRLVREEARRADAFNADVTVDVEGSGASIAGDDGALREALANLLDNAVRHARRRVTVHLRRRRGEGVVRVSDDGPGLPDGAEEEVFERFVSLDGAGGSGLGLPIARAIARRHGGELAYRDGAFVLTLPAEIPAQATPAGSSRALPGR